MHAISHFDSDNNYCGCDLVCSEDTVGHANIDCRSTVAIITHMVIYESFRGKDYSSVLLDAILESVCDREIDTVSLKVHRDNAVAIHVYEKYGFKLIHSFHGYLCMEMKVDREVVTS